MKSSKYIFLALFQWFFREKLLARKKLWILCTKISDAHGQIIIPISLSHIGATLCSDGCVQSLPLLKDFVDLFRQSLPLFNVGVSVTTTFWKKRTGHYHFLKQSFRPCCHTSSTPSSSVTNFMDQTPWLTLGSGILFIVTIIYIAVGRPRQDYEWKDMICKKSDKMMMD